MKNKWKGDRPKNIPIKSYELKILLAQDNKSTHYWQFDMKLFTEDRILVSSMDSHHFFKKVRARRPWDTWKGTKDIEMHRLAIIKL